MWLTCSSRIFSNSYEEAGILDGSRLGVMSDLEQIRDNASIANPTQVPSSSHKPSLGCTHLKDLELRLRLLELLLLLRVVCT